MRIAIFDYETTSSNPYGKGILRVTEELCDVHDFTVYSTRFENPRPDRIRWRRVPALRRPMLGLFLSFQIGSLLVLTFDRLVRRQRFDIIQSLESAMFGADVIGVQFCHRAYLRHQWRNSRPSGWRGVARWLFEWSAALLEPLTFRSADVLVVPSKGLAAELAAEYPATKRKITVVSNAIEGNGGPPPTFDRREFRKSIGIDENDFLLVFVSLGHFERKGLPLVLEALGTTPGGVRLMVVGGTPDLVSRWEGTCRKLGLEGRVTFTGQQRDPRPFLWASDAFVFPSAYETFSYVTFEAAAAGLPIIVSELYGVQEFLVDGENGILVPRDAASISTAIRQLLHLDAEARRSMGRRAQQSVAGFSVASYTAAWSEVYRGGGLWPSKL